MQATLFILVPLLPAACALLCFLPLFRRQWLRNTLVSLTLTASFGVTLMLCLSGDGMRTLFTLMGSLPIVAKSDSISRFFALLISGMWLIAGVFSFGYFAHDAKAQRYFAFYLLTEAALLALCFAGTLVTMYICFETMTLCSLPLVLHNQTREAVAAGIKYLVYSIAGAMMGLFGIFFLTVHSSSVLFTAGGMLNNSVISQQSETLLWVILITVVGFGTKAGMFPMHGWLPTAHPVAPGPASAVLSGVIVKAGVLCIIRVLYYAVGARIFNGTWVQTVLLSLSLVTVFMGSMLALAEKSLKKRLAYSTVSQISYILFGLFVCNETAFNGALLHVWFHSIMKTTLFLCAGAMILQTGKTRVDEMRGIGKRMPATLWSFTLAGVGLVGIPPLTGFISKWNLASGALASNIGIFSWLGPVVLLISALLTAGYLLPVSITAFFPGASQNALAAAYPKGELKPVMLIPLLLLALLIIVLGIWPVPLQSMIGAITSTLL